MDSVGIGELPDAHVYGDAGSNTLGHIYRDIEGFTLPNLERLGIGNIDGTQHIKGNASPTGCFGRAMALSPGKDSITGHWEITGIVLDKPLPTYPEGFPDDVIRIFEMVSRSAVLGNEVASGTEIIERLGEKHIRTGYPIVYTSADSVFQVAAHEGIIPLKRLYDICANMRDALKGEHGVARVIARPFIGEPGAFVRTANRRDYSIEPPGNTLLDYATGQGYAVVAVGKIYDIFSGRGITRHSHTKNNSEGIQKTKEYIRKDEKGIIFTNLVDFDMQYGHRNNVEGYGRALREFDLELMGIMDCMTKSDLLILTADHGCDPTTESTDHSREYIPILIYGQSIKRGINVGTRKTFADIGATIAEALRIKEYSSGKSFLNGLIKGE